MSQIYSSDTSIDNPVTVAGGVIDATGSAVSVTNFPVSQSVSGSVSVSNFPATQPVSGSVNVGNFPAVQPVSVSGTVNTLTAVASTATLTITAAPANTDTLVLASNGSRKSAIIFIPRAATSVKYGNGATLASFTFFTGAANTTIIVTGYTGQINVFGPAQSINATELV